MKTLNGITPIQISNLKKEPFLLFNQCPENYISIPAFITILYKFKSKRYDVTGADIRIKLGESILTDSIPVKLLENDFSSFFYTSILSTNPIGLSVSDCLRKDAYLVNIGNADISLGDGDVMLEVGYSFLDITR